MFKQNKTTIYYINVKNNLFTPKHIRISDERNTIQNKLEIISNELKSSNKTKILIPSEAKIEATIAKGTTIRHEEYMDKIVPYETGGATIPFEINCKCHYERKIVEYFRIDQYITPEEKRKLFSRAVIGNGEFQIKPAWAKNEVVICKYDDVSLKFNGKKLSLLKNGIEVKYWEAMSGRKGYNFPEYQSMKGIGPLPQGKYDLKKANAQSYENIGIEDKMLGMIRRGTWPGGKKAWGEHRIWLTPQKDTNTLGRNRFSVHGGSEFGSAGCIDLAGGMNAFMQDFVKITNETGRDLIVLVKY